jgi:hypothetical protein
MGTINYSITSFRSMPPPQQKMTPPPVCNVINNSFSKSFPSHMIIKTFFITFPLLCGCLKLLPSAHVLNMTSLKYFHHLISLITSLLKYFLPPLFTNHVAAAHFIQSWLHLQLNAHCQIYITASPPVTLTLKMATEMMTKMANLQHTTQHITAYYRKPKSVSEASSNVEIL